MSKKVYEIEVQATVKLRLLATDGDEFNAELVSIMRKPHRGMYTLIKVHAAGEPVELLNSSRFGRGAPNNWQIATPDKRAAMSSKASIGIRRARAAMSPEEIQNWSDNISRAKTGRRVNMTAEQLAARGRAISAAKKYAQGTDSQRFWAKVDKGDGTGCWLWIASKDTAGYGMLRLDGRSGRNHRASRLSLEWHLGRPLSNGMWALHKCDTPACVKPDHLYEGTKLQNARDRVDRGRAARGSACGRSVLNDKLVLEMRKRYDEGERISSIASSVGCTHTTARNAVQRLSWTHL